MASKLKGKSPELVKLGKIKAVLYGASGVGNPTLDDVPPTAPEFQPLVDALEKIARPRDCGCLPCRGDCVSREALLIEADELKELARQALGDFKNQHSHLE